MTRHRRLLTGPKGLDYVPPRYRARGTLGVGSGSGCGGGGVLLRLSQSYSEGRQVCMARMARAGDMYTFKHRH